MQITRLRITGFKSFVEPAELLIEPGLTGVVGPNGCGKSNLLESLRWVMGETSHKSMRAASMDDVIFAGTTSRPARNWAEVTIVLDNSARTAPVEFNDRDVIEITRRIEREAGSAYRINGSEARARDVKILFEDAATGARSPALVRQGQIGEIVNAKPENRRRILEDAAGVAGLHSRRHEAELRLKAAETNLARLGDLMGSLTAQLESLKRQARHARRYKELSAEIRRTEALYHYLAWRDAHEAVDREETALREVLTALAAATESESKALREEAHLAEAIGPLRDEEAIRAAVLARLKHARDDFEREAERAAGRATEIKNRAAETADDLHRAEQLAEECAATIARLADETARIAASDDSHDDAEETARARLAEADAAAKSAESRLSGETNKAAESRAQRRGLETRRAERQEAATRLARQAESIAAQIREATARAPDALKLAALTARGQEIAARLTTIEEDTAATDARLKALAAAARSARETAARERLALSALKVERETLAKLLLPAQATGLPAVVDQVKVAPGFETALGAALGDDLDASLDHAAGVHWRLLDVAEELQGLPADVEPLLHHVEAPLALSRRLRQIGIVTRERGHHLQPALKPGQRLVSREGDLWRWDGFVAAAGEATPAAIRLAEKNRLADLADREADAAGRLAAAEQAETAAAAELLATETHERDLRTEWRAYQTSLAETRDALTTMERAARETQARLSALEEAQERAGEDLLAAHEALDEISIALDVAEDAADDGEALRAAEAEANRARAAVAEARQAATQLIRDRQARREREASVRDELARWEARRKATELQTASLRERLPALRAELATLADLPGRLDGQRQSLLNELSEAERQRDTAADAFRAAESGLKAAASALKAAQAEAGRLREQRARLEARLEAARARRSEEVRRAREAVELDPEACLDAAALTHGAPLPPLADTERQLARLKGDRERLGAVNLQADEELKAIEDQVGGMASEIADVETGITKLRGAIGQLNREARKRLNDAFTIVDGHFRRLFSTLFGGGEARLEMIESEDPLEAGLEIIAKPPGKKPATLSLLSGGEQTLTALSLIFAVFLTNPSPICVLDEVDAPLDDSNVDRFCLLMEKMASETDTRFLVITHHPMTMARTNRLFGVTMAEKGISQLVSVDLQTAVTYREAG